MRNQTVNYPKKKHSARNIFWNFYNTAIYRLMKTGICYLKKDHKTLLQGSM